jgi:hypothetical protein
MEHNNEDGCLTGQTDGAGRVAVSSRRAFLAITAVPAFGFTIVPRHVLGGEGFLAPSERVNVAGIGAGGMGGGDIATVARLGANAVSQFSRRHAQAAAALTPRRSGESSQDVPAFPGAP